MGAWRRVDVQVTPTLEAAPMWLGGAGTYDLSATVGVNQAIVCLRVDGGVSATALPSGVFSVAGNAGIGTFGRGSACSSGTASGAGTCQYLLAATNSFGIIDLYDPQGVGGAAAVTIIGYFVPQNNTPAFYAPYNISDIDGVVAKTLPPPHMPVSSPIFAYMSNLFNVGGLTDTNLMTTGFGDVTTVGGGLYCGSNAVNVCPNGTAFTTINYIVAEADTLGQYQVQIAAGGGGPHSITTGVLCTEEQYYNSVNATIGTSIPILNAPTPIDISAWTGTQDSLAILRVTSQAVFGRFIFGPAGIDFPESNVLPALGVGCSGIFANPGENAIIAVPVVAGQIIGTTLFGAPSNDVDIDLIGYISQFQALPPAITRVYRSGNVVSKTYPGTFDVDLIDRSGAGIDVSSIEIRRVDSVGNSRVIWSGAIPGSGITGQLYGINNAHGLGPVEVHLRIDWDNQVLLDGERCTIEIDATNAIGLSL